MRKQIIYCPKCARHLYTYNGKTTMDVDVRCECGRYYNYDPQRNMLKQIARPERTSAAGARFY